MEKKKYSLSKIELREYDMDTSEADIIQACQYVEFQTHLASESKALYLNYLSNLLNLIQQKKMLEDQNVFNKKLVDTNKGLVKATYLLATVTILLALVTYFK